MPPLTQVVQTFPSVRIPGGPGQLPVEVALIAQLGIGAGDQLYAGATARQRSHEHFVDELDEPSTRLGGMHLARNDPTSLYSFSVGAKGHPFHRHAGHRVFTAVSGSGGAQLRFSTATSAQLDADPRSFLHQLHFVDIPPDSLFTVRFGGETWHQFAPRGSDARHPAFFALSCHTNELGGALAPQLRAQVLAGEASIPALTELLPPAVSALLASGAHDPSRVPTVALALDAAATSPLGRLCAGLRGMAGRLRGALRRWRPAKGFLSVNGSGHAITALRGPQPDSLLREALAAGFHHEDTFELLSEPGELRADSASAWLAALLPGFLDNPPAGVTRLMALRNVLVRPLGLRRSPLGCPVSSLLTPCSTQWFAERFPVLSQRVNADDHRAEVLLGADDKHLRFRSCVSVEIRAGGRLRFSLGTRVQCLNRFGRFYMASIDRTHRGYVAPAMLSLAAAWAIARRREE